MTSSKRLIFIERVIRRAARFLKAGDTAIRRIFQQPELSQPVDGRLRRRRVLRFPYGILYELRPDEIIIVAMMHLARKPGV